MSLMSPSLGDCGGMVAVLFDGTWKLIFPLPAIDCASEVSAQSYHFLAFSMFLAPLMMLMLPISKPVPSQGDKMVTLAPFTACTTASCWNVMPTMLSPVAAARAGAAPDFVYWLTFLCSAFMYSNALSSPISCTNVASIVYDVPDELGLATWISSLNTGLVRSAQHLGSG